MGKNKIFENELPEGITSEDSQEAFQEAINEGRLSMTPCTKNYINDYMYMLTKNGKHQFKSISTRLYLDDKPTMAKRICYVFNNILKRLRSK